MLTENVEREREREKEQNVQIERVLLSHLMSLNFYIN